jgi:hypothetical protein
VIGDLVTWRSFKLGRGRGSNGRTEGGAFVAPAAVNVNHLLRKRVGFLEEKEDRRRRNRREFVWGSLGLWNSVEGMDGCLNRCSV